MSLNPVRPLADKIRLRLFSGFLLGLVFLSGCGPQYTYPAQTVVQSIKDISLKEYQIAIQARVVGKTAGAIFYVEDMMDDQGQIRREIHEKMGQVMQAVTRVALSTDKPLDYAIVIARDRKNLNELAVVRSIDDTKRASADMIGIEESINRTIFRQGKYRPVKGRSNVFALKEITLPHFLAEQIVQRIRFGAVRETQAGTEDNIEDKLLLVDGVYDVADGSRIFRFSTFSMRSETPGHSILEILKIASAVLKGYQFVEYDQIQIHDYLNRQKLALDRETVSHYQAKRVTEKDLLERFLTESQSIQEAFKLFGFEAPENVPDAQ
ncbi:MAG: hypothetical protein HY592_01820 [Candidatus Omnitrophica bacterium]|nr:hypothetical protein [Candidatus Omnitrophota bacterium]